MTVTAVPTRRVWVEQIMGMPISVHVRGAGATDADTGTDTDMETAVVQAFSHLRRVDAVLSPWRADSDLMRVRRGELSADVAHPWLAEVRGLCTEAAERTGGLFTADLPDRAGGPRVFDPTGLVKGWAVEGAARLLALVDGTSFCINAGGDILAGTGRNVDEVSPWRVGIEDPAQRTRLAATVELTVGAVATSGNAARGAHITDPRTCRAVNRPGSATVTGPSLLWADIWATAMFVDPEGAQETMALRDPAYRSLVL